MPAIAYPGRGTSPNGNVVSQGGGNPVDVQSMSGAQGENASGGLIPFSRGSRLRTDSGRQLTGTMGANVQQFSFTPLPTTGYLAAYYLVVQLTTAANAAAVAFNADAPWNFFRTILFRDATGVPIVNLLTGYQMYLNAKFGGFRLGRPEGSALAFSTTTGAVGAGGSFTMVLPIYQEFGRDTLGVLANMDASAGYQLDLTIGTTADLYSVAPTNPGTFTITLYMESYTNPPDALNGQRVNTMPPALGSTQFFSAQNYSWSGTGEQTVQLVRVGNLIRNLIFVWRTAAGARANTVPPTFGNNIRFELDQSYLENKSVVLNQFVNYRYFTFDLETGVTMAGFMFDPDNLPTGEFGDRWLPTLAQTRVAFVFTPGVAGALEILVNDIAPVGDIYRME